MKPTLHLVCQAHLDPVWLWPSRDGFAEALTTTQSAVNQMDEFPGFRYTCSSAAFYRWIKKTDPRLFRRIRELVRAGRWEVVGGWVVEADTLHPTRLSLRRQGQLAQNWFKKNLDVTADIGYCVDSFGHSAGLPSILNKAGMHYYVFQRPNPHERPDLPNLFWWEAPDGKRVLTWRLAAGYGQKPGCTADELETEMRQNWRDGLVPEHQIGTWFIGVGNHGGGPTRSHIKRLCMLRDANDPDLPNLQFSTLADFFADVEKRVVLEELPVLRGEQLHHARGCYSANTRFKRLHRQAEHELQNAENLMHMCEGRMPPDPDDIEPPPSELHEAWWSLCFNQFHDILPGSSVPTASRKARETVDGVRRTARQQKVVAVHTLARRVDTHNAAEGTLFLANPLPWSRTAVVQLDTFVSPHDESPITHLVSPDGHKLPLQWTQAEANFGPHLQEWGKLVTAAQLPPGGTRWFHLAHGELAGSHISSFEHTDLPSHANDARLIVVGDEADTWGHDVDQWNNELGQMERERTKLLDDGPVLRRNRRWYTWNQSSVIVDEVQWQALQAVEIVLYINWQERYQTLKLELPLQIDHPHLRVRTPGTVVDRPLDGKEWFWGDWLTLTNSSRGTLVASEGVSAYDATPERLRLTLLRCVPHAQFKHVPHPPDSPAPFLDEGFQKASVWLTRTEETTSPTKLEQRARGLLVPAEHMLDSAHPSSTLC